MNRALDFLRSVHCSALDRRRTVGPVPARAPGHRRDGPTRSRTRTTTRRSSTPVCRPRRAAPDRGARPGRQIGAPDRGARSGRQITAPDQGARSGRQIVADATTGSSPSRRVPAPIANRILAPGDGAAYQSVSTILGKVSTSCKYSCQNGPRFNSSALVTRVLTVTHESTTQWLASRCQMPPNAAGPGSRARAHS
jgi:hypothetical protein